ncbi:uncharacterized protein LOC132152571 [Carassius carassius]|uniref:uncharacterized protein LOC132152571 n=1 Tax=Carassius carassius TaxID=217509 RepID=UPI0028695595|nr:uncharacterized protein LOC132152571 [Carassius carassius]
MVLFLEMLVIFLLHVSTDAQGPPKCPLFKVQRGTVHKAFINKPLKISCNLMHCDEQTFNMTWTKEELKEWIPVSEADQMSISQYYSSSDPKMLSSYLTFTNISKHHGGLYRCELKSSNFSTVSHYINVSVSGNYCLSTFYVNHICYVRWKPLEPSVMICWKMKCLTLKVRAAEREISDSRDSGLWWLPYLFISLGIVILVVMVTLISILFINGFKSSRRKNLQRSQVQYTATSVLPSSPSRSVLKRDELVCVQYSEESQQHSRDSNTCSLTLPPGRSALCVSDCSDDPLSNRRESRSSQVVYASLHHLAPSSATPRQTQEEFSEYASIRVS